MNDLNEILEKVREAKGSDRQLDAMICANLNPPVIMEHWMSITPRMLDPQKWEVTWGGYLQHPDWWHEHGPGKSQAPRYTSSIDECLSLLKRLLPSWNWMISKEPEFNCSMWDNVSLRADATRETLPLAVLNSLLIALVALESVK